MDEVKMLDRIDATVDGVCAGPGCTVPLTPESPSAWWCSPDCQSAYHQQNTTNPGQVHGSDRVEPDAARWRPDLVDNFDDTNLEPLWSVEDEGVPWVAGTARRRSCWRHVDGRRFLRLDDGNRWVGLFPDDPGNEAGCGDPAVDEELWRRLERELTDPRRLDPAPGSVARELASPVAVEPLPQAVVERLVELAWAQPSPRPRPGTAAETFRGEAFVESRRWAMEHIAGWLSVNGIDPGVVPLDAEIVSDGETIRYEVYRLGDDGQIMLGADGWPVRDWATVPARVPPYAPVGGLISSGRDT